MWTKDAALNSPAYLLQAAVEELSTVPGNMCYMLAVCTCFPSPLQL